MKQRILLLGAQGFWGKHFASFARSLPSAPSVIPVESTIDASHAREEIHRLMEAYSPTAIINFIGTFSGNVRECYETNTFLSLAFMDAIRDTSIPLILIGTAAEYGMIEGRDLPLCEDHALNPVSDYGISKAAQAFHMRQYVEQYGIDVRLARVFNLVGSGISSRLAPGGFAQRIAVLKQEGGKELVVGNIKPKRDYLGVSIASQMLMAIIERGGAGEIYNVCSGYSIPMEELIMAMLKKSGLGDVVFKVDPGLLKRFDVPDIYGSREKITALLPELTHDDLVKALDQDLGALLEGAGVVFANR